MAENPQIDDKQFFAQLDEIVLVRKDLAKGYPWEGVVEDRGAAESAIVSLYEGAGMKPPKMAWAQSPRSMWGAMTMLRQIQKQSRHQMIRDLVPRADPIETETKRVLLEATLDRDITVSTGANVRDSLRAPKRMMRRSLHDLADVLGRMFAPPLGDRSPSWKDSVLYPLEHLSFSALTVQSLCVMPYMKMCWFCRPPLFVRTNDDGYLHCDDGPAVRFADGFEIWVRQDRDLGTVFSANPVTRQIEGKRNTKMLEAGNDA